MEKKDKKKASLSDELLDRVSGGNREDSICPKGGSHEWIEAADGMYLCAKCHLYITL